jgi:hypothetical protein
MKPSPEGTTPGSFHFLENLEQVSSLTIIILNKQKKEGKRPKSKNKKVNEKKGEE